MNGVVLWDDNHLHDNQTMCERTKQYVDTVLGPFVQQLGRGNGMQRRGNRWTNQHHSTNPFSKHMRCRTNQRSGPIVRTRPHRFHDDIEIVIFNNQC